MKRHMKHFASFGDRSTRMSDVLGEPPVYSALRRQVAYLGRHVAVGGHALPREVSAELSAWLKFVNALPWGLYSGISPVPTGGAVEIIFYPIRGPWTIGLRNPFRFVDYIAGSYGHADTGNMVESAILRLHFDHGIQLLVERMPVDRRSDLLDEETTLPGFTERVDEIAERILNEGFESEYAEEATKWMVLRQAHLLSSDMQDACVEKSEEEQIQMLLDEQASVLGWLWWYHRVDFMFKETLAWDRYLWPWELDNETAAETVNVKLPW